MGQTVDWFHAHSSNSNLRLTHLPCAITGFELMTSLVLYRGLQRAAALFADVVTPAQKQRWLGQAEGIRDNLHRLWSDGDGAYFAGSKDCRQINVWANGLAYWLSAPEKQRRIWWRTWRRRRLPSRFPRTRREGARRASWRVSGLRWLRATLRCFVWNGRNIVPGCPLEATPKPPRGHVVANGLGPTSHPHATLMRPSCDPQATLMRPSGHPQTTLRLPSGRWMRLALRRLGR